MTKNEGTREYLRKIAVAGQMADSAWLAGGLDGIERELKDLYRLDADPVIIAELTRIYHRRIARA